MIFHPGEGEHGFRISRETVDTWMYTRDSEEDEAVNQWKTICQTFRAHPTVEWQLFTFRFSHLIPERSFERGNSTVVGSNKKKEERGEGEGGGEGGGK